MKKVYIVGGDGLILNMFLSRGWAETLDIEEADLIQFTGGADVYPDLYGEHTHPHTYFNMKRDLEEKEIYNKAKQLAKPMAGICRGGQFLNVMNGGKMWQHVNKHAIGGTHEMSILEEGRSIYVTSTHHQMMKPSKEGLVLATAKESTFKEHMYKEEVIKIGADKADDVEVVYYKESNSLCAQYHPEYKEEEDEMQVYYFSLINDYLGAETNET